MISINFDNVLYVLIAIPLLALLLVSFIVTFRKANTDKHVIASFVLHIVMIVCMSLAVAGMSTTATLTQTHVYVVADVSYSSARHLEKIDERIQAVESALPHNSKMGVVCFGRDCALLSGLGEKRQSVATAEVDNSATDIYGALTYTSTLFENDVIKRIVLITDGRQTGGENETALYNLIETFKKQDIYIDAVFVDATLPSSVNEVQTNGVDFVESTYVGQPCEATVFLQSSYNTQALVHLYKNGTLFDTQAATLINGPNDVTFDLDTTAAGDIKYRVEIEVNEDDLRTNNNYTFTQKVVVSKKVLLVTSLKADVTTATQTYGEGVEIDSRVVDQSKPNSLNIPTTLEELCVYDEIVLSNVDIRTVNDYTQFIENLNTVVSTYGKSLLTFGDLQLQMKTDDSATLTRLENMMPIKFGMSEQDPTLYGIVLDASHSMNMDNRWSWAIDTAKFLINQMRDTDAFAISYFYSTGEMFATTQQATVLKKQQAMANLDRLFIEGTGQGTYIASGLKKMKDEFETQGRYNKKQVILISDGNDYAGSSTELSATGLAAELRGLGARVSALNIGVSGQSSQNLQDIVSAGGGTYYEAFSQSQLKNVLENSITDNLMGTVVQVSTRVNIQTPLDDVVKGITSLSNVQGYICGRAMPGSIVVLNVEYKDASGAITEVPLYAYKDCGNGRVATFTSSLSGRWVQDFLDENGKQFFNNVITTSTPTMRVDYPFALHIETGDRTRIEVEPSTLSRETSVKALVTAPDGTQTEQTLAFDGVCHFAAVDTLAAGEYTLLITYTNNGVEYTTTKTFYIAYLEEYNRFAGYDAGLLYQLVDERGKVVTQDEDLTIENDPSRIATYTMDLTFPLMIACVLLFVVDVIVRKLKWQDIKGLFVKIDKTNKGGKV